MATWNQSPSSPLFYVAYCVATVLVLKEVNSVVWDAYMVTPPTTLVKHLVRVLLTCLLLLG